MENPRLIPNQITFPFSWIDWALSWSKSIFLIKVLYLAITHFNGLNMEIQQVFIFFNNLRHLVSKILASFVNFKNFLIRTMNEKKRRIITLIQCGIPKATWITKQLPNWFNVWHVVHINHKRSNWIRVVKLPQCNVLGI